MRIGIDLGGMSIKAGLVDESLKIRYKKAVETDVTGTGDKIISDMIGLIHSVINENPGCTIEHIGIGVPGYVDKQQIVQNCNNIPLNSVDLRSIIGREVQIPINVDNDANVAALGEVLAGAAKNYEDAVMITIGTGIGSGIVIGNQIYRGCNGAAGELGHIVIEKNGVSCNCGRRGCYEKYASASALIEQTKQAMKEHPESIMWELCNGNIDSANGKTAFDAWRKKDAAGTAVLDCFISYLATGLVDIVNMFQPEAIIIGGGISKEGDTLLNLLLPYLEQERYTKEGMQTDILIAQLGNDAGIIGASQLS